MSRRTKKKTKDKLYLLVVREADGRIASITPHNNYDDVLLEAQDRAKTLNGFYEIFDKYGRLIEGNTN